MTLALAADAAAPAHAARVLVLVGGAAVGVVVVEGDVRGVVARAQLDGGLGVEQELLAGGDGGGRLVVNLLNRKLALCDEKMSFDIFLLSEITQISKIQARNKREDNRSCKTQIQNGETFAHCHSLRHAL